MTNANEGPRADGRQPKVLPFAAIDALREIDDGLQVYGQSE